VPVSVEPRVVGSNPIAHPKPFNDLIGIRFPLVGGSFHNISSCFMASRVFSGTSLM
jgi:hypothetical protein